MKIIYAFVAIFAVFGLTGGQNCGPLYWTCDNGKCALIFFICDGMDDCGDWSDEGGESGICPNCPPGYFKCDNGRCRDETTICDGDNNCLDWSDEGEIACPCGDNELRCSSYPGANTPGKCIPPEQICDDDGIWDCPFGDDESNCTWNATEKVTKNKSKSTLLE